MKFQYIFLFSFFLSCSSRKSEQKPKLELYDNIAIVTPDSCENWSLPLTHFSIEYPSTYQPNFKNEDSYLNLRRFNDSGATEQEFAFGRAEGVRSNSVEKVIYSVDSFWRNLRAYQSKSIGYRKIGNKTLFVSNGVMDFDLMTQNFYKGKYRMLSIVYPSEKPLNGVLVTILTKSSLDSLVYYKEVEDILGTLKILKK